MHVSIALFLLIAAFILFVIAALPFVTPKIELIAAGLACTTASVLFG